MTIGAGQTVFVEEVVDEVIAELMADAELQGPPLMGRIFPDMEDGDRYPVLVVTGVTGENVHTLSNRWVWRDTVIQFVARDKGGTSKANLVLIVRRVCILLEGNRIQRNGLYIGPFSEARQRPRGPDDVDGELYPQIVLEFECKAYRP